MKSTSIFTIIIPIYNGDTTIKTTLNSILKQNGQELIDKIILINDGSTDKSSKIITDFKNKYSSITTIITHHKSVGLAASLNEAIKFSNSDYIITLHQDVIVVTKYALIKLKNIINKNPKLFYIYPTIYHPKYVWNKYNFWQKCLFSRYVGTKHNVAIEKFDCINRQKLINIGLYDQKHFRTAGEDIDLIVRATQEKFQYISSKIKVIHLHSRNPNFSFFDLVKKEKQLAETKGVLLRLHGLRIPNIKSFFREIILISLLIPKVNYFGFGLLIIYSFGYNWRIFQLIGKDNRVIFIPLINLYLFFANITSSTIALFSKKQII